MKKTVLTVLAIAALISVVAGCKKKSAQDNSLNDLLARGEFVLGLDDSFPPLGFRDDNNEIVGYDIDLATEVAKRLGVNFRAQPISWDAKEQELATGNIDCIWNGLTITPERLEALSFTKPYLDNEQAVVVTQASGYTTLAELAGKTIGLQAGSSAADAVEASPEFKASLNSITEFKDNVTALNDLEIGGVDGVVMDSVVANYVIKTTGKPFTIIHDTLASEQYGVAFRKGDVKLSEKVQAVLEEMEADGTVAELSRKWFGANISVIGK